MSVHTFKMFWPTFLAFSSEFFVNLSSVANPISYDYETGNHLSRCFCGHWVHLFLGASVGNA